MKLLTRAFADWCHAHNIPLSDVTLVVRATDERTRDRLEAHAHKDVSGMTFVTEPYPTVTMHGLTLNGVRVSFSTLDRSRTQ